MKTKHTFAEYLPAAVRKNEQVATISQSHRLRLLAFGMLIGSSDQSAITGSRDNDTSAQS